MCNKTTSAAIKTVNLTTTPQEIIGPNPRRVALVVSIAKKFVDSTVYTETFTATGEAASDVNWFPPVNIKSLVSFECWGAGGNGEKDGTINGGGGGGGYSKLTNPTLYNGTYGLHIDNAGNQNLSFVSDPAGNNICVANSGTNASGAGAGAGGSTTGAVGTVTNAGGNGAAGVADTSGGGGGGSGSASGAGGNASGSTGGTSGAGGGAGGNGGGAMTNGVAGTLPGGGGGGANSGHTAAAGASGQVIVSWTVSDTCIEWTLSQNPQMAVGQGTYNFLGCDNWNETITEHQIGSAIKQPWYAACDNANGCSVEIMEILADEIT